MVTPAERNGVHPHIPNLHETELAEELSRLLARMAAQSGDVQLRVIEPSEDAQTVTIPQSAFKLLVRLLSEMARGHGVTVMPHHAELTTQQAADMLNVSRPYLVKLLESGEIPFRLTGAHRRVRFDDLMESKGRVDQKRRESLDALATRSHDLNLDDVDE